MWMKKISTKENLFLIRLGRPVFSVGKFVSFQFEGHESYVMLNINEMRIEYA